ncbi:hypothetical protein [uncultured Clostridium sp.]|uniref:hypothetical protein n=1 Tax=uncultured Clostridium sp. TaxID=59620 RepID=UPI0025E923F2|nr:hypothetical protein [uncultured Clostridium sp.]
MNIQEQKLLTLTSDVKFAKMRLDPAKHQPLIDILIDVIDALETNNTNLDSVINNSISQIEKCILDNNLIVPSEISELIKSFSVFLPN